MYLPERVRRVPAVSAGAARAVGLGSGDGFNSVGQPHCLSLLGPSSGLACVPPSPMQRPRTRTCRGRDGGLSGPSSKGRARLPPELPPACFFLRLSLLPGACCSAPTLRPLLLLSDGLFFPFWLPPPQSCWRGSHSWRSSVLQKTESRSDSSVRELKSPGDGVSAAEAEAVTRYREQFRRRF